LPILETLQDREDRVCRHAAIADIPKEELNQERRWLEEQNEDISDEERQAIEQLLKLHKQLSSDHYSLDKVEAPNFTSLSAEERTRLTCEALAKINAERQALFMPIKSLDCDRQDANCTETT
jgi:hypothetical protein